MAIAATANAQTSFTNSTGMTILDNNTTGVSQTVASNLSGLVTQIEVNIRFGTGTGATGEHTFMGDLLVQLSYNDGNTTATVDIFSRIGRGSTTSTSLAPTVTGSPFGSGNDLNGSYNFGDQFFNTLWAPTTVAGSSGRGTATAAAGMPTNVFTANFFDPGTANGYRATTNAAGVIGADGTPHLVSLNAAFGSMGATGTWTLFVRDLGGGDTGGIASWSVTILPTPGAAAMLGLGGLAAMRRRRA